MSLPRPNRNVNPQRMKTTAKKKRPPSAKMLAHLRRLNKSRRKAKKPGAKKPAAKPVKPAKPAARKPKEQPAPKPASTIPPVELPKGDAPGQTTMPVVEQAVAAAVTKPVPASAAPGEEML